MQVRPETQVVAEGCADVAWLGDLACPWDRYASFVDATGTSEPSNAVQGGPLDPAPDASPVDRVTSMLEDDAYRTGGRIQYASLLRLAEKAKLDAAGIAEVHARLLGVDVEVEGAPDGVEVDPKAPSDSHEASADEPSTADLDAIQIYLKDAAKYELLSAADEVALARRIRAGEDAKRLLEQGRADPGGRLAALSVDGRNARDRFLAANMRLVLWVAKPYERKAGSLTLDDLLQEGNIGLMRATDKFDHTRGFKFSTYAIWWIRQAITRAIADKRALIRVPVHMQEFASRMRKVRAALLRERGGRPVSTTEIAEHLGASPEKVQFLLDIHKTPVSLDAPVEAEGATTLGECLPNTTIPDPHELAFLRERRDELDAAIATLSPREQKVLHERFDHERTLQEVGDELEVTRERIRQLEAKALTRLRHPSRATRLAELLDFVPENEDEEKDEPEQVATPETHAEVEDA
jgi:RNA polymerase primary sigma factor